MVLNKETEVKSLLTEVKSLLTYILQIFDYCRFASVLNKETEGPAALQKAVVQSFLHNYDDAILVLDRAAGLDPSPSQYILLGLLYLAHSRYYTCYD